MEIFRTSFAFRNRRFPLGKGRALQFIYGSKQVEMRGGLKASTATTNVYKSDLFKTTMKGMQSQCISPDEVVFATDFKQSLYCHLLCGLVFSDEIQLISSTFAHSLVNAFRSFELLYQELCEDIRVGCVSASRVTIPTMRDAVQEVLFPNPELADQIYRKCRGLKESKDWGGVIPAIFPNVRYLYGIMTGSMEPYLNRLRHYAGEVPLVCADYGASEGWVGVNILPESPPETASFAVLPNIGFYEFIPLRSRNGEDVDPVGIQDVKTGEEYEVVITNFAGLYRYRLGDVVKIAGFYNKTPLLKFQFRRNLLLNINVDKTTEKDLQMAVENASVHLMESPVHLEVIDFTSHADVSSNPGHYVLFWELNADAVSKEILHRCADAMDMSLVDIGYVRSRKSCTIGALELRLLRKGTFKKILEHYVEMGAAASQFKTPRCVGSNNGRVLQILSENVVGNYFSNAYNQSMNIGEGHTHHVNHVQRHVVC